MDLDELKKINSNSKEVKTNNEISERKLSSVDQDLLKYLASEQVSLSELIRRKMEQDEKNRQELEAKLLESEKARNETLEKVNKIIKALMQDMKELKETNFQKLDKASQIVADEVGRTQENNSRMIREVMDLVHQVRSIPNPGWKEKTKQYAAQILVSAGMIALFLGAYQVVSLLMK